MSISRRAAFALAITLLLTAAVVPVAAHQGHGSGSKALPSRIDLPDGFQPEGIASWGGALFAGSLVDGSIWKANARTGSGHPLVTGSAGMSAAGLHVDHWGRLWVAGATDHTIRVYSARNGHLLQTYTFPTAGFINDLTITRSGVYATDSTASQVLVVPIRWWGRLPSPDKAFVKPLTGDLVVDPAAFNANGIVSSGRYLVIVQSNTGKLFRVDPRTGVTRQIDTGGYSAVNGDGLVLAGRTLYVIRNQDQLVAVLRLGRHLSTARLVGEITSTDPTALSVPTTGTITLGALWVVNARFGVTPTPTTEYWITRLPLRP